MHCRAGYAISEIVGFVLVLAFIASIISMTLVWALPFMNNQKADVRVDSALNQFEILDVTLHDMIGQGVNSSRVLNFVTDAGYVYMSKTSGTRFVIYYSLDSDFDFNVSGFDDEDDNKFTFTIEGPSNLFHHLWIYYLYDKNLPSEEEEYGDGVITAEHLLSDAVQINVNDSSNQVIGRIWLFDVGAITYEMSSSYGVHCAIVENGGVIRGRPSSFYLYNEPRIYKKDDCYVIRIIQLQPDSETTGGGGGTAMNKFTLKLSNSCIRENTVYVPDCFKMQIYGGHASAWINYFKMEQGFSQFPDGTLYLRDYSFFTLTHSICDVDLEVFG